MPQLHINHELNQVEIEDHLNLLISPFGTGSSGVPEFTYEYLLTYFLYLPTSPRSTAQFGEDWWRLQIGAEQIMSGQRGDSERFFQCERPDFFCESTYLELVIHGDGTESAAIRAPDGEFIEDYGVSTAPSSYYLLMRSLKYLVDRAKEAPGYFPVTSWFVTYPRDEGDKDWKIWFLAGCEKGVPPRWSPYWPKS